MLMIGFLLCEHYSVDTQGVDLWHLINPKLELTIPKETVIDFVKDLLKIAVDLNFQYIQNLEKKLIQQGVNEKVNATKVKEEESIRKRAIKYLDLAQRKIPEFIEKLMEIMPPLVSKMDLHPILKNQVYRSHQIRTLLTNTY